LDRDRFQPYLALYRDTRSYSVPDDVPIHILGKYKPWHNIRASVRLARWIDEIRPDVLVSAWSVPNVFAAETLRWTRHRPVWLARVANNPKFRETGLYGAWARGSYRRADGFIAVCRGLAEDFVKHYPFASERTHIVYNSVDPADLRVRTQAGRPTLFSDDQVHLLAVGRLHPQKRFDLLLRALAIAVQDVPVHLHILGSGEEEHHLRRLAADLQVTESITWHGFVDDPCPLYAAADVFVLTSDYEGLSNSLLEAQALGLPAVVTDCPFGSAEVVEHERTGLVAPVGDLQTLSRHIIRLAKAPEQRGRMGAAAHKRIEKHFSLRAMLVSFESLLARYTQSATAHPH
jgi:glycosyltransferase involved in cell wall biosynthesis